MLTFDCMVFAIISNSLIVIISNSFPFYNFLLIFLLKRSRDVLSCRLQA